MTRLSEEKLEVIRDLVESGLRRAAIAERRRQEQADTDTEQLAEDAS